MRLIRALRGISAGTAALLAAGLLVSDLLLFSAVILLLRAGGFSIHTYPVYILAHQLEQAELGVLFSTTVLSALWQERFGHSV